jgi:hypothetical protein
MAAKRKQKVPAPYTSSSLEVSRKMVAPGPLHEEQSIIHDLIWRYKGLQSSLPYYDRTTGKPIAEEAERLRKEAWQRIEKLPDAKMREAYVRSLYQRD